MMDSREGTSTGKVSGTVFTPYTWSFTQSTSTPLRPRTMSKRLSICGHSAYAVMDVAWGVYPVLITPGYKIKVSVRTF